MALLVPLAVFMFLPTSVLVVLGQEYLPHRVGMASGVTLGLAVSVGGMCAPLLGRLGDWYGMGRVVRGPAGRAGDGGRPDLRPAAGRPPQAASAPDDLDELLPVTAGR